MRSCIYRNVVYGDCMMYALLGGIMFGISTIILKYFVVLSFPAILLNVFTYLFLIFTGAGFMLLQLSLKKSNASVANAVCTSLTTVTPILLAITFFGDSINLNQTIGIILILFSIGLIILKKK